MINDYLVRWSTANHHNVATQLMHQKTHSFAIQNQASHVIFNSLSPEGRAVGVPNPPLINLRHNHNAPWHSYEVWSGNLVWLMNRASGLADDRLIRQNPMAIRVFCCRTANDPTSAQDKRESSERVTCLRLAAAIAW
jgi:hypothetical protein